MDDEKIRNKRSQNDVKIILEIFRFLDDIIETPMLKTF